MFLINILIMATTSRDPMERVVSLLVIAPTDAPTAAFPAATKSPTAARPSPAPTTTSTRRHATTDVVDSTYATTDVGTAIARTANLKTHVAEKPMPMPAIAATSEVDSDSDNARIHVITTFFRGNYSAARFAEVVDVARRNLANPYIKRLHLLWEGGDDADPRRQLAGGAGGAAADAIADLITRKLVARRVARQATYARLLRYANEELPRGSVAIVTNADIYFDTSLKCIGTDGGKKARHGGRDEDGTVQQPMLYALSRSHAKECGFANDHKKIYDLCSTYVGSHDAFVFRTPVAPSIIALSNHTQNQYGAENIVIYEFRQANYRVRNPCKQIKAFHLHCSKDRSYDRHKFVSHGRHARQPPPHAKHKHRYEVEGQAKVACGAGLRAWHAGVPRREKHWKKSKKAATAANTKMG